MTQKYLDIFSCFLFFPPSASKKNFKSPESFITLCGYIVNELDLPIQLKWTNYDVLEWVEKLGFPQYCNTFKANLINGRTLLLVDASALVRMNIKDFGHVKTIANEIRDLYKVELEKFGRSISLLPKHPETHYKFYKTSTGPVYEMCQRTDFFQKLKLSGKAEIQLNHFEKLHQWLKHIPGFQSIRVGGIRRINLFFVKPNLNNEIGAAGTSLSGSFSTPSPNFLNESEQSDLWSSGYLVQIDEGKPHASESDQLDGL